MVAGLPVGFLGKPRQAQNGSPGVLFFNPPGLYAGASETSMIFRQLKLCPSRLLRPEGRGKSKMITGFTQAFGNFCFGSTYTLPGGSQ